MLEVIRLQISEDFVRVILQSNFHESYQRVYDQSFLIQYLDSKMRAVHRNSKSRRSFANIYAVYAILHFYQRDYYQNPDAYRRFLGYDYTQLLTFCRSLYGGSKLQNHALNSRVNGEFRNKFPSALNDLIISNNGKYLLHIDYLYVGSFDISRICCEIIERYIQLISAKDHELAQILEYLQSLTDISSKKAHLCELLHEETEARIFEIISYSILKNHYKNTKVYFGYSPDALIEESLQLYKTGRTNANDGGIDFVMRPLGRFFQVTEVDNYDKYLLDIDKVLHFPVTFVIKTTKSKDCVLNQLDEYISRRSGGMIVIENHYRKAIEEIITINELLLWIDELNDMDVTDLIRDIDICYRLEMNLDIPNAEILYSGREGDDIV